MITDVEEYLWQKAKAFLLLMVFSVLFSVAFVLHWQRISVTRIDSQRKYYVNPADYKAAEYVFSKNDLNLERLQVIEVDYAGSRVLAVHVRRMFEGMPVSGADIVYYFDEQGFLDWENEGIVGYGGVLKPLISLSLAASLARFYSRYLDEFDAELVLYPLSRKGPEWQQEYRLAWEFTAKVGLTGVVVDARNGRLLHINPEVFE